MELSPAVRLVAVSKFHPLENILEAYAAGQMVFGESRPQELQSKLIALHNLQQCTGSKDYSDIRWHFIGHLQTNKLSLVLPYVALVQSVDSLHLLQSIDLWGAAHDRRTDILLECHIASESTKQGFSCDEVVAILLGEREFRNVRFCGLMGMATFTDDETVIRGDFARIKVLFDEIVAVRETASNDPKSVLRDRLGNFCELSIGMSDDYRIAMEYGATMVRIGTDIFGPRNY